MNLGNGRRVSEMIDATMCDSLNTSANIFKNFGFGVFIFEIEISFSIVSSNELCPILIIFCKQLFSF